MLNINFACAVYVSTSIWTILRIKTNITRKKIWNSERTEHAAVILV